MITGALSETASDKLMEKALEGFVDDFIKNGSVQALGPKIHGRTRNRILTELGSLLLSRSSFWEVPLLIGRFSEIFKKNCELEVGAMQLLFHVDPLPTTEIIRSLCQAESVMKNRKLRKICKRMMKEACELAVGERLNILLKEKDEKVRKLMSESLFSHINNGSDVIFSISLCRPWLGCVIVLEVSSLEALD